MKKIGLIVEYNPFHNGHLYHIKKAIEGNNDAMIIVVMTGNFVQRGKMAIVDKFTRCEMALANGADIVIELPFIYSSSSAENFAYGSVTLLNSLGVDEIVFGSECGDINELEKVADFILYENKQYIEDLRQNINRGFNFPKAREIAVNNQINGDVLSQPNNILGIEYIKAIKKIGSRIIPRTIKRKKADYHDELIESDIASATAIRRAIINSDFDKVKSAMPKSSFELLKSNYKSYAYNNLSNIFHYNLNSKSRDELLSIVDINEDLLNRIYNVSKDYFYLDDIVEKIKSKNYTYVRIQRVINNILLNNTYMKIKSCPYARVLGFNKKKNIINEVCSNSQIPVIVNLKESQKLTGYGKELIDKDILTSKIYYMAYNVNFDEYKKMIIKW